MPKEWNDYLPRFQEKVDKISNVRELSESLQETWDLVESLLEAQVRDGKASPELQTAAKHIRDEVIIKL